MSHNWPSAPRLIASQTKYQLLSSLRSPVGMFFTLVLPLVILVLFNALFGDQQVDAGGGLWDVSQFYTGGLAAFTAVSATYTNLVNVVPIRRDEGVLKRWRSTPIPSSVVIAGWVLSAVAVALLGVLLQLALGVVLYGVEIELAKLPAMLVVFVIGVSAFAALGLAIAGLVPNADSAPAVANATILPLAFISDVFIPQDDPPVWLEATANFFPLKPFANAFQDTLNPFVDAPGFATTEMLVVLGWGIGGALLATATFTWEPSTRTSKRRTKRNKRVTV